MLRFRVIEPPDENGVVFELPTFSPEAKTVFAEFIRLQDALLQLSVVKQWEQFKPSIHIPKQGMITNSGSLPSDEQFAALLHRMRPFYLNKEPTNFNTVTNSISQHVLQPAFVGFFRDLKQKYRGQPLRELFQVMGAGRLLNSEGFLDDYLNGIEYHRDKNRQEEIQKVAQFFTIEAQRVFVVLLLMMRVCAISELAAFLALCLQRENGEEITLQISNPVSV